MNVDDALAGGRNEDNNVMEQFTAALAQLADLRTRVLGNVGRPSAQQIAAELQVIESILYSLLPEEPVAPAEVVELPSVPNEGGANAEGQGDPGQDRERQPVESSAPIS